jgi:general stress protein YciG
MLAQDPDHYAKIGRKGGKGGKGGGFASMSKKRLKEVGRKGGINRHRLHKHNYELKPIGLEQCVGCGKIK